MHCSKCGCITIASLGNADACYNEWERVVKNIRKSESAAPCPYSSQRTCMSEPKIKRAGTFSEAVSGGAFSGAGERVLTIGDLREFLDEIHPDHDNKPLTVITVGVETREGVRGRLESIDCRMLDLPAISEDTAVLRLVVREEP
jgi:hypothetical protein